MQTRTLTGIGIFILVSLLATIFLNDTLRITTELYAEQPDSYRWLAGTHQAALYALTPLVVTAMIVVLLTPGILLVLASGREMHIGELILKGFGLSFLLHIATTSLLKISTGGPVTSMQFTMLLATTLLATYLILIARSIRGNPALSAFADSESRRRTGWLLAIPALFVTTLLPAIFWQELNSDGFEAMEIGRSLSTTLLPAFTNTSGTMGLGIGMIPMAYPVNWFILLSGPLEAATRLPMAMYLMVVFATLLALIEHDASRRLRPAEEAAILLALAVYTAAMSLNSGYDSYFTDMSSPGAFETLTVIFILASGYLLWAGMHGWFLLFTVAGFLARPTVLLFVILLGAGIALVSRVNRRTSLAMIGLSVGIWIALLVGYEHIYLASVSGDSGPGYPSSSILGRFQFLTFDDFNRLVYAAAPAGLLPALSLLAYRWQDSLSRCLTIVSVGYFLVFYVPAFTSLHHFVPVMILPVVVLWRLITRYSDSPFPAMITGGTALLFLWLSLPANFQVSRTFSELGSRMLYRVGDYNGSYADWRRALSGTGLFVHFFRADWDVEDPAMEFVGGDQLLYYASRRKPPEQVIDYMVLPASAPAPAGFTLLALEDIGSTWVRDASILEADRQNPPPTGYRSHLYDIKPETLFYYKGVPAHNYNINLSSLPLIWRLFSKNHD